MEDKKCKYVKLVRDQCLQKGVGGIKALSVAFRHMDVDYSKAICLEELKRGLQRYRINLKDEEIETLFSTLDKDQSGQVDFAEFMIALRPPMPQARIDVINEVFDMLDTSRDGKLEVSDLKGVYSQYARKHENYIKGVWTEDQVLRHFLDAFDSPDEPDGIVTREEFLNFYAGVSSTIEDTCYFDFMMRQTWGLPMRRKSKAGNAT
ncbi:calcyphosin-like protein [Lingula anatina]|uniref:Calcyphosin-like protein n=1 Tax=Lingula anatina TaxID=7574 RepID=A0A1S3HXQ3_LINAN|nr:calcyphosin-like protein [Lingula anatina]XP_013415897.1 calcyphosin-like protein [Lingula anatina]|eukprot:XP_013390341.1 calcyphosin-like protein [Lingula anatina]